jgi:hypothetical protein
MALRFYTNMLSHASRTVASGVLVVGLLLIGFGMLIAALPQLFAYLAAAVFFVAGIACAIFAVKIFWIQRRLNRLASHDEQDVYRRNVRIHIGDRYEP